MKTLFKYLPLFLVLALFSACSSDDDTTRDLVLSVKPNETKTVTTDQIDYEFQILDGNGGYFAKVSEYNGDPAAKVNIDGNNVKVNILTRNGAEITIIDAKNNEQSFWLQSTNELLIEQLKLSYYAISLDVGQETILSGATLFTFGAGAPYTIERMRGMASEASILNGYPRIKALSVGIDDYKLKDKRGSVLPIRVISGDAPYELSEESRHLEIETENNYIVKVNINWGDEWRIVKAPGPVIENVSIDRPLLIDGTLADYQTLSIHTINRGSGCNNITLEDKDGMQATITLIVRYSGPWG